ncbi:MAG: hypothetical protein QXS36_01890 [Candidatus Bathyarchaeia archaeon]|nr:hypothetical protein [Candidatus Bathyarchaeota archaeon]
MPEEILIYLTVIFGIIAVASVVLLLMERERRRATLGSDVGSKRGSAESVVTLTTFSRTVPDKVLSETRDKLRVLDVEREIMSYALRRLYEAHAEGKITAEERDSLALKYREELERIKQEIARGESIIALCELERMREEFIKTFSEKFDLINKRIEELKAIAGLTTRGYVAKPVEEEGQGEKAEGVEMPTQQVQTEKQPAPRRRREVTKPKIIPEEIKPIEEAGVEEQVQTGTSEGGEADKRIEQIVAEIEKVLNKLTQMEIE